MDQMQFITAVFIELMDDYERSCTIRQIAAKATAQILDAAAWRQESPVAIPMCADGVDADLLLHDFLMHVRPDRGVHDQLGDYRDDLWESAWPEGVAHVIFDSPANDHFWAAELLGTIDRLVEHAELSEPSKFDVTDFEEFVAEWRARFVRELRAIKNAVEEDAPRPTAPPYSGFPPTNIQDLNSTPLSRHIETLLHQAKAEAGPGLILASLALWARDNLPELDWHQVRVMVDAVLAAELKNARRLYANLAQAPGLMEAQDLKEAAMALLTHLTDFVRVPPQARG